MKANEAPEKLYFPFEYEDDIEALELYSERCSDKESDKEREIEYTRTDAFIEKAVAWFKNNTDITPTGIRNFKKAMKL